MASPHQPVSMSGLALFALIAGLSQVPAQAQANTLEELSRQEIGSNFSNNNSPTTLPGSPSIVEGGSENTGRVVGDLVDQEIRRRPVAAAPAAPMGGPKTVQLLVPVRTGLEFAQIEVLVPGVKILEMNGDVFVLVSETAQALPAYRKGRELQAKLSVEFQLAYSDSHPDLNLAWMASVNSDVATAPKPVTLQKPVAIVPPAPSKPGTAKDLGLLVVRAPWMDAPASVAAAPLENQEQVAFNPLPPAAEHQESQTPDLQRPALSTALEQTIEPLAAAKPNTLSLRDTLAELRAMGGHSAQPAAQAGPTGRPAPLVQAVAIRPSSLGDVPLVSNRFMAVNQDLAYVYVKVQTSADVAAVKRISPVAVVHDREGQLLARVGVYTNSRIGDRLRKKQMQQLQQLGYEVELIAGRVVDTSDQA